MSDESTKQLHRQPSEGILPRLLSIDTVEMIDDPQDSGEDGKVDLNVTPSVSGVPHSRRRDHFKSLLQNSFVSLHPVPPVEENLGGAPADEPLISERDERFERLREKLAGKTLEVEVRMIDFSFHIPIKTDAPSVKTVLNQSPCYGTYEFGRRFARLLSSRKSEAMNLKKMASNVFLPFEKHTVLSNINLVFKPGKTYVILGPPGGGKTTLLKAIAGRLPNSVNAVTRKPMKGKPHISGRVEYNGVSTDDDPDLVLANVASFVGQLDHHAPYLTVSETFEFAHSSRTGGSTVNHAVSEMSENLTIEGLDLTICKDTFVGDANVRGVSGGQRRRVTVGEMMQGRNPVACADEISTGLDAAVTYDIIRSIVEYSVAARTTRIISLLQPGPETFSLFDEVVLLAKGFVVYSGPISKVVDYFNALGYNQPATMDVADFLQLIPTPDGALLFDADKSLSCEHYSAEELAEAFRKSNEYENILRELEAPYVHAWNIKPDADCDLESGSFSLSFSSHRPRLSVPPAMKTTYQNSNFRTIKLNFWRHFILWKRDIAYIIGKSIENIGMAIATGGILFRSGIISWDQSIPMAQISDADSEAMLKLMEGIYGALFMATFHILLGIMTGAPDQVEGRTIHYKHGDANFYQCSAFVIGRMISTIPQRTLEIVAFGIPLYWMIGLVPKVSAFLAYIALLVCYTVAMNMLFGILPYSLPKKADVQGVGTFFVLLSTLFGGYIVFPGTIPFWFKWIYWLNPMAWALQGLASIEFTSDKYVNGDWFLSSRGFQTGPEWISYSFCFLIPYSLVFAVILVFVLKHVRIEPERMHLNKKKISISHPSLKESRREFNLPFTPVDLTFKKLVYEVKASTGDETLRLLNEVSGVFKAGRLCALMGSSGAGKTTLMDVIAMRKTKGDISGEIRLNGFLQERTSFLRCSGYVEQFDVQQAELTVWETVVFCARLRLDADDANIRGDRGKLRFVDHVLEIMELTKIQNLLVGSYEEGGLTFEQRKRLAIACELAGSPSVIFLDEPTSGLDSRGALLVMRAMKRICDAGRTVCATIHQPSSTVFEMFDDLLLLKQGGNVVFFGELGEGSCNLIDYFEARGAPPIEFGENPAAWMLRAYSGEAESANRDWGGIFKESDEYKSLHEDIEATNATPEESNRVVYECLFPTSWDERLRLMNRRLTTVYKRSPAYNLTRMLIATFYAFVLGSVFLRNTGYRQEANQNEVLWSENQVDGIISTMYLSLIIVGFTSISMAVPVMKKMRDVFYKHRASGMLDHNPLSWSLMVAETPYLCLISLLFGSVYYLTVGLFNDAEKFIIFWVFFALNVAIYSYFGQAFICLVKDIPTAGALVGTLVGFNIFFSGLVVKPQYFVGAFQLGFWTAPGRFAFEGITMNQFAGITQKVKAQHLSPFYFFLGCGNQTEAQTCEGTIEHFVIDYYFGGRFTPDNFWLDSGVLVGYLILARLLTWFSLKKFNYVNT